MTPAPSLPNSITFGRFRVLPRRRELLADDKPVKLGGRAFDLLMALIEKPGAVIGRDDLMARVWPDRVVVENNLQIQILSPRHILGAERGLIGTVTGRGYQFTGEIQVAASASDDADAGADLMPSPEPPDDAVSVPTNLPQPVSTLIGHSAEVEAVANLARANRLVTLTGPGGIGKTRLAIVAARGLLPRFPDGVWLAEFSPLSDPGLVPAAVAADLESIDAVAKSSTLASPEVVDGISSLVAKSLVVADLGSDTPLYHLLDTTRDYAAAKLAESGERDLLARRHAAYYRDLFLRAELEFDKRRTADWLHDHGRQIDNVRAALNWAFAPGGDVEIGVALTAAAIPLCVQLSLLEECRLAVERALGALAAGANVDPRREMKLQAALGTALIWASDATVRALGAAWTRASELAAQIDDIEYQLRSLLGLWFFHRAAGQLRASLADVERFGALAASRGMTNDQLIGDRLIGLSQHFIGDQPTARRHLEHMLAHYVAPVQQSHVVRFLSTQRGSAGSFLARVLWLQGFPDQAVCAAEDSANDARASGHANSLCYVLAEAGCPIALWTGDFDGAGRSVASLIDLATRYSLTRYLAYGHSHRGVLVIRRGDIAAGLPLLRAGLDELGEVNDASRFFMFQGTMAEALGRAGRIGEGLAALDEAITCAGETEERWSIAELLRIKGELLLWQAAPGAAKAAANLFLQALDWARRQDALSWELRAATSFARLLCDQGQAADAKALLAPVYARFTEGFETADLKTAQALLRDVDSGFATGPRRDEVRQ